MSRAHGVAACLAGALACGEAPAERVAFGEVCGEAGPVRLLELTPGRQLSSTLPFRVGDRRYYRTTLGGTFYGEFPTESQHEVWSTGLCGEDPRLHATGLRWISPRGHRWPGFVVGCGEESNELVVLDPAGGPPSVLMPGTTCDDQWTEHGVVSVRTSETDEGDDTGVLGSIVLQPYPTDPRGEVPPPRVLHPQVLRVPRPAKEPIPERLIMQVLADEVLTIDAEDRLVRIDLVDGEVTIAAEHVLAFRADEAGRDLLWQRKVDVGYASPLFLQDLDTGTSVALGTLWLADNYDPFELSEDQVVGLWDEDHLRVLRRPELQLVDLPRGHILVGLIDERRWLLRSWNVTIFDTITREETILYRGHGEVLNFTPERAMFLANRRSNEGTLYRIDLGGGEPRIAAPRASRYARFRDEHQLVSVVGLDNRLRGELVVVDIDEASEQRLDDRVPMSAARLDAGFGPGHLVYSVDDGARSGIYVVRLPDP